MCRVRHYRAKKRPARSEHLPHHDIPRITVIRPICGLEPHLYECLASTFKQTYPADKLSLRLCLPSRSDPGASIAERVVRDHAGFDARVFYEDEDVLLQAGKLGPNPKIRNMSRAYREASGDLIWIIDCNVWVAKGVAGRMVDTIEGFDGGYKTKFVHQLPLAIDVSAVDFRHDSVTDRALTGSRVEEMFLASSHAKFYTAINTVLIAPCIVGKSNMFRRSHLDELTTEAGGRPPGIDYFSHNICEDHLIGDLLWRLKVQEERGPNARTLRKHAMVFGDVAVQPIDGMSIQDYVARRVRWLRVRKFTVPAATLVEPATECFVDSAYGAFALTWLKPVREALGIGSSWSTFAGIFFLSVCVWAIMDWTLSYVLHSMASVEVDENTPAFIRACQMRKIRPTGEWLIAWVGRESLALYIWLKAIVGGVTVIWRGRRFRVGFDASVVALDGPLQNVGNGTGERAREESRKVE